MALTDIFFIVTFCTEPGIIPARLWGSVLPAKYKGVDVRLKDQWVINRTKLQGYSIGNYPSRAQLCTKWSFVKHARFSDHHAQLTVTHATTVCYTLTITACGLVLALGQEITSKREAMHHHQKLYRFFYMFLSCLFPLISLSIALCVVKIYETYEKLQDLKTSINENIPSVSIGAYALLVKYNRFSLLILVWAVHHGTVHVPFLSPLKKYDDLGVGQACLY